MTAPKTVFALVGAACVGFLVGYVVRGHLAFGPKGQAVNQFDDNEDGKADGETVFTNGIAVLRRHDRNFDGKWDEWQWFDESGRVVRSEQDNNFDGLVDGWVTYHFNQPVFSKHDVDGNGVPDLVVLYKDTLPSVLLCLPNAGKNHCLVQFFEHGIVREEYSDSNGNGLLDTKRSFDVFGRLDSKQTFSPEIDPQDIMTTHKAEQAWRLFSP